MVRALMVMGTGSDAGKSLLVTGLCRAFANRGLAVRPFKPQNMSNNAAVTADGGEIGRAQALQAQACRVPAATAMNPVLLKPEGAARSQLVVRGQRRGTVAARDYWSRRATLLPEVVAAFDDLAADADLVMVEGAGSASEINLRPGDIANFGFSRARNVPVVLAGDIERGGVIAALVGTFGVIDPQDRAMIVATLVNKFRGDPALFAEGAAAVAQLTGVPCLGPVPWFDGAAVLPAEDSLALAGGTPAASEGFTIAVPQLPHIANFDDLDPLRAEPGVRLLMVAPGTSIPRDADLIVLPGSKSTRADLQALRAEGWDIDIAAHVRAGRPVLGICGGYQMLGRTISDPRGIEGPAGDSAGLGLLAVDTLLTEKKQLRFENGVHTESGEPLAGYHMHLGETTGEDRARPFARVGSEAEGAVRGDGLVAGTYLHGLFAADGFRRAFLSGLHAGLGSDLAWGATVERTLDALARHLEANLDLDRIFDLSREPSR